MFTHELEDRPVAVLNLPTAAGAEELLGDREFRKDLTALQYEGRPLWDGQALLSLREATADERAEFERSLADEEGASEDDDEGGFVIFLVDVTEPEDSSNMDDQVQESSSQAIAGNEQVAVIRS